MKKILYVLASSFFILFCSIPLNTNVNSNAQAQGSNKDTVVKNDMSDLTELEKETFQELNLLRKSPKEYVKRVEEYKKYYSDNYLVFPDEIKIITNEGVKAVDECIEVLKVTNDLPEFILSKGLTKAAKSMVEMQSKTSETGHTGTDGSSMSDRISKFGTWGLTAAENIDYGSNKAQRIVMSLIIDDGVSSRGHRKNLLNPKNKYIGLGGGSHKGYRHMFVMDFAGEYTDK